MSKPVAISMRVSPKTANNLRGLVALRLKIDPCASMREEIERLVAREVKRIEKRTGATLRPVKKIKTGRRPNKES